jgi:probable HAF family extracellular repeat protein
MPYRPLLVLVAVIVWLPSVPRAQSTSFTFTKLHAPGALETFPTAINARGQIVGHYHKLTFPNFDREPHGFLLDRGSYTTIDFPGGGSTYPTALNAKGQIVGHILTGGGSTTGFVWEHGVFTLLGDNTRPVAINDSGQIAGSFTDSSTHGFLKDQKTFTVIDFPGAAVTNVNGINARGQIVGSYREETDGPVHGFLLDRGTFTSIDVPDAVNTTALGINNRGQVVGSALGSAGTHGFLLSNGTLTVFDVPSGENEFVTQTHAAGINARGDIVGDYREDIGHTFQGFVASPR